MMQKTSKFSDEELLAQHAMMREAACVIGALASQDASWRETP